MSCLRPFRWAAICPLWGLSAAAASLIFQTSALASADFCEGSHLVVAAASSSRPASQIQIEKLAENLASFRLHNQISDVPNEEKSLRDQDFQNKMQEFIDRVGSRSLALRIYQDKMRSLRFQKKDFATKEKEEKNRREIEKKEFGSGDPFPFHLKPNFIEINPTELRALSEAPELTSPFAMMDTPVTQLMWARIQILAGNREPSKTRPSHFVDGPKTESLNIDGVPLTLNPIFQSKKYLGPLSVILFKL